MKQDDIIPSVDTFTHESRSAKHEADETSHVPYRLEGDGLVMSNPEHDQSRSVRTPLGVNEQVPAR